MGSFPIILRFDSLGWYNLYLVIYIINTYTHIYFNIFFLYKKIPNKTFSNKLKLNFIKNNLCIIHKKPFFKQNTIKHLLPANFSKLIKIISNIFLLNKNIIIIDYDFNYNYLPLQNEDLFSRSHKNFTKHITYFDVLAVFFLNLNKKKFIFKKLFSTKVINISLGADLYSNKFDFKLNLLNNKVSHYLVYIYIMNTYISLKNKILNINGPTLFFF
jgi:hypothetical protein